MLCVCGGGGKVGLWGQKGEALGRAEEVIFLVEKKPGCWTAGKPEVTDLVNGAGFDENSLLALAAALEIKSEHPLARAVVSAANKRGIRPKEAKQFLSVTGAGLKAVVDGNSVLVGNQKFLLENGVTVS